MELDTSLVRYTQAQTRNFYKDLLNRASAVPGVRVVTLGKVMPLAPSQDMETFIPEAYQFPKGQVNASAFASRSEEHTSELQSRLHLVCRLLLEKTTPDA